MINVELIKFEAQDVITASGGKCAHVAPTKGYQVEFGFTSIKFDGKCVNCGTACHAEVDNGYTGPIPWVWGE